MGAPKGKRTRAPEKDLTVDDAEDRPMPLPLDLTIVDEGGDDTDSELSEFSGLEDEEEDEEGEGEDVQDGGDIEAEIEEADMTSDEEDEEGHVQDESSDDDQDEGDSVHVPAKVAKSGAKALLEGPKITYDASETDTDSEDEAPGNTIGNVPMEWYNEFPHIGYDLDGKRIMRPAKGDELDEFLAKMDNPDYWRTVKDFVNEKDVVLSDKEVEMIRRIQEGQYASADSNPYEPYMDYFTGETEIHAIGNDDEPKRRFIPSKWEHKRVMKLVRAIRKGWIKLKADDEKPRFYELWDESAESRFDQLRHLPAPRMRLPGHEESYNPPPEYLPTQEEIEEWKNTDAQDRPRNFIPQKYSSLRLVPRYDNFIQERFERCLDLYLAPRARKTRMNVDPESLIPKLPKPRDLQPFPTECQVVYKGHTGRVRTLSPDPTGQWLVSGSDDHTVRVWEVLTGRCMRTLTFEDPIMTVAWCPNVQVTLIAIAVGDNVVLYNPMLGSPDNWEAIDTVLARGASTIVDDQASFVKWKKPSDVDYKAGYRVTIAHDKPVKQVAWHYKGEYFSSVSPDSSKSVVIHQLSKRRSQSPFKNSKGLVQCVQFHPTKPFFFVATQRYVRVYNLTKQELAKKLTTGVKWISSMDIHPQGDNLIIGSYDKRLCWFDMDLSTKPYKTLRYHNLALRSVTYHKRYPLFASASDDGKVHVFHGRVFSDLLHNPLIVPVKVLSGHQVASNLGVLDCKFHPVQPWLFSAGADSTIRLFT